MKTIVIESNYVFEKNKRGIGHQLWVWLINVQWNKYSNMKFILTHFEGENIFKNLPSNVSVCKLSANNFEEYVKKIYKDLEFDLIFFQTSHLNLLKEGVKTVGINYGMENLYCRKYIEADEPTKLINRYEKSLQKYDLIITVSKTARKDLIWFFPEYADKIKIVYTGIHPDNKQINETKIKKLDGKKYFFVIGYEHKKNIIRIASAFDNFKKKTNSDFKLVIAGKPGFGAEQIDEHIAALKSKNDIIKLGYISDGEKLWLLKNCHSLVALAIYEGFGLSALEGLLFNKIVLVSNNGSIKEVVGKAGYMANPFDINDIERQMTNINYFKVNPRKKHATERLKIYDQKLAADKLIKTLISVLQ